MSWTWRLENAEGEPVDVGELGRHEFGSRSDAESWVGEFWRELLAEGVDQVRLRDGEQEIYGPMSLHPPD